MYLKAVQVHELFASGGPEAQPPTEHLQGKEVAQSTAGGNEQTQAADRSPSLSSCGTLGKSLDLSGLSFLNS